jgi:tRNA G18 (ribose-2'-O)-methylase SpoU
LISTLGENDPRLEPYRHVGDARWLLANDLFVAEGRLVVARVVVHGAYTIESVLATPVAVGALEEHLGSVENVYVVEQAVVNRITGFNFHRGCLALVRRPPARPATYLLADARRLIVLEGVGNPDNIGGIFRSAAAFGVGGILLDPSSADPLYRKAVRTSMGAVLRVPFARLDPLPQGLEALREAGLSIVALTPTGRTTADEFATRVSPHDRIAIVAGAEGAGLTERALSAAHETVRIPIDPASDSLNVVVAVSIALQRLAAI